MTVAYYTLHVQRPNGRWETAAGRAGDTTSIEWLAAMARTWVNRKPRKWEIRDYDTKAVVSTGMTSRKAPEQLAISD